MTMWWWFDRWDWVLTCQACNLPALPTAYPVPRVIPFLMVRITVGMPPYASILLYQQVLPTTRTFPTVSFYLWHCSGIPSLDYTFVRYRLFWWKCTLFDIVLILRLPLYLPCRPTPALLLPVALMMPMPVYMPIYRLLYRRLPANACVTWCRCYDYLWWIYFTMIYLPFFPGVTLHTCTVTFELTVYRLTLPYSLNSFIHWLLDAPFTTLTQVMNATGCDCRLPSAITFRYSWTYAVTYRQHICCAYMTFCIRHGYTTTVTVLLFFYMIPVRITCCRHLTTTVSPAHLPTPTMPFFPLNLHAFTLFHLPYILTITRTFSYSMVIAPATLYLPLPYVSPAVALPSRLRARRGYRCGFLVAPVTSAYAFLGRLLYRCGYSVDHIVDYTPF